MAKEDVKAEEFEKQQEELPPDEEREPNPYAQERMSIADKMKREREERVKSEAQAMGVLPHQPRPDDPYSEAPAEAAAEGEQEEIEDEPEETPEEEPEAPVEAAEAELEEEADDAVAQIEKEAGRDAIKQLRILEERERAARQQAEAMRKTAEAAQARIAELEKKNAENEQERQESTIDTQATEIVESIYSGDTDQAKAAVKQILEARSASAPTADPNEIAMAALEKIDEQNARQVFLQDYRDVLQDEDMFEICKRKTDEVLASGEAPNRVEAVKIAGDYARSRIAPTVKPDTPEPETYDPASVKPADKERKNRAMARATRSKAATGQPPPPTKKVRTRSDVIADMAASRIGGGGSI